MTASIRLFPSVEQKESKAIPLLTLTKSYLNNNLLSDEIFWRRIDNIKPEEKEELIVWIKTRYIVREELIPDWFVEKIQNKSYSRREWIFLSKIFYVGLGVKIDNQQAVDYLAEAKKEDQTLETFSAKEKQFVCQLERLGKFENKIDYVLKGFKKNFEKDITENILDYIKGNTKDDSYFWRRFNNCNAMDQKNIELWLDENYSKLNDWVSPEFPHRANIFLLACCRLFLNNKTIQVEALEFCKVACLKGFPCFSKNEIIEYYTALEEFNPLSKGALLSYLKSEENEGHPRILASLGYYYLNLDKEIAIAYFEEAFEKGELFYMPILASIYYENFYNDRMQEDNPIWQANICRRLMNILEETAMDGVSSSLVLLGNRYYHGLHVESDFVKARSYFEAAAQRGHLEACFQSGMIHLNTSVSHAYHRIREAAEGNVEIAVSYLLREYKKTIIEKTPGWLDREKIQITYNFASTYFLATAKLSFLNENEMRNKKRFHDARKYLKVIAKEHPDLIETFTRRDGLVRIDDCLKYPEHDNYDITAAKTLNEIKACFKNDINTRSTTITFDYLQNIEEKKLTPIVALANKMQEQKALHPVAENILVKRQKLLAKTYNHLRLFVQPDAVSLLALEYATEMHSSYLEGIPDIAKRFQTNLKP